MKLHLPKGLFIAVMAVCVANQGSWATGNIGWSTGKPQTELGNVVVLYIGDTVDNQNADATNRAGLGEVTLKEEEDKHIVISSVTVPNNYNSNLEDFRISSDGDNNQVATIQTLNVKNGSDITVGVSGWNSNSFKNLIIDSLVVAGNGTASINIHANQTVTLGNITGVCDAEVADDAKLYISGSNADTNGNLVVKTTGAGDIVLTANARLGSGSISKFHGSLEITGNGTTLYLGNNEGHSIDFSSFSQILLNKGGKIEYNATGNSTFNNITVEEGTGEFRSIDNKTEHAIQFAGHTSVNEGATLNITAKWNSQFNVEQLTGSGAVKIYSANANNDSAEQLSLGVESLHGFTGDISVHHQLGESNKAHALDIDIHTGSDAVSFKSLVLNRDSQYDQSTYAQNYDFYVEADTTVEKMVWEKGTTTINADKTLTVGKQGVDNDSIIGSITGAGTLVKDGLGTLTLSGVSDNWTGNIEVSGGTLKAGHSNAQKDSFGSIYSNAPNRTITVKDGAALDINGHETYYHVVLEKGATLKNTGGNVETSWRTLPVVELKGNADVVATGNIGMQKANQSGSGKIHELDLNGHTLTKSGTGTMWLINVGVTAGTIKIAEGQFELLTGVTLENGVNFHLDGGSLLSKTSVTLLGGTDAEKRVAHRAVNLTTQDTAKLTLNNYATLAVDGRVDAAGDLILKNGAAIELGGGASAENKVAHRVGSLTTNTGATVTVNENATLTINGALNLYAEYGSTKLDIATGASVTQSQGKNLEMNSTSSIELGEGAKFTRDGEWTITGLAADGDKKSKFLIDTGNFQRYQNNAGNFAVQNADVRYTGGSELKVRLHNSSLAIAENTKATINRSDNSITKLTVESNASATFGGNNVSMEDILLNAQAQLSFTDMDALSVSKLEMGAGAGVSVSTADAVGTLTVNTAATFNGGNVNANLTLADNATVTINDAVALGSASNVAPVSTTETAYTLSLGTQLTLQGNILEQFDASAPGSGEVILFSGVDTLKLGGVDYNALTDVVKLSDYFRNDRGINFEDYYIGFNEHGDVYAGLIVPEPTTATLSLLALAGLCARRRRASR